MIQNNWVIGTDRKMERAQKQKQWFLDEGGESCLPSDTYLKHPTLFDNNGEIVTKKNK